MDNAGGALPEDGVERCGRRLEQLSSAWGAAGTPAQLSTAWKRDAWLRQLADHHALLDRLPNPISRLDVAAEFRTPLDDAGAVDAFIATMIWGHGPNGYGAWRTRRILSVAANPAKSLRSAVEAVRLSPSSGYAAMGDPDRGRLRWLGPAFGTKFLCFASDPDDPAPILDALVAQWIRECSGHTIPMQAVSWSTPDYTRYLRLLEALADGEVSQRVQLEYLIFADAAVRFSRRPSPWVEEWVPDIA